MVQVNGMLKETVADRRRLDKTSPKQEHEYMQFVSLMYCTDFVR